MVGSTDAKKDKMNSAWRVSDQVGRNFPPCAEMPLKQERQAQRMARRILRQRGASAARPCATKSDLVRLTVSGMALRSGS